MRRAVSATLGSLLVVVLALSGSLAARAANPVVSTIGLGGTSTGVAISPDGTKAYVGMKDANSVKVVDVATDTITTTIPVGQYPFGIAFAPDGTKAYVANIDSNTVSVIDVASDTVAQTIAVSGGPRGVAVSPDGTKLYVANMWSTTMSVINTATATVTATLTVGSQPVSVAFTPDGTKAYVVNTSSNSVSVIDVATDTVTSSFSAGVSPAAVAFTRDGTKAYLANISQSSVSVIDVATNTQTGLIGFESNLSSLVEQPYSLAMSPDGQFAYAVLKSRKVAVIDVATDTVASTVTGLFSGYAWGAAITPDGSKLYTTDITVNTMSVVTFPAPIYTVTFDANGGTGAMTAQDASAATALSANTFSRTGYTFSGWNTAANGSGVAYADAATFPFTGSATLYSQWTVIAPSPAPSPSTSSAPAQPVNLSIDLRLAVGQRVEGATVAVSGTGLQTNAAYTVEVRSTPVIIASGSASASGSLNVTATVPSGLSGGWHTITFTTTGADGTPAIARLSFEVSASGRLLGTSSTVPAAVIAATGSTTPWSMIGWACVLVLAGSVLSVTGLRRSRRQESVAEQR